MLVLVLVLVLVLAPGWRKTSSPRIDVPSAEASALFCVFCVLCFVFWCSQWDFLRFTPVEEIMPKVRDHAMPGRVHEAAGARGSESSRRGTGQFRLNPIALSWRPVVTPCLVARPHRWR